MLVNFVSIFWPSSIKFKKLAAEGKGSLEVVGALGVGAEKSLLDREEGKEAKGSAGIPAVVKLCS